jgi:hypothetical protein
MVGRNRIRDVLKSLIRESRFLFILNLVTILCCLPSQYEVSLLLGDTAGQLEVLERAGQSAVATLLRSTLADTGKQTEL